MVASMFALVLASTLAAAPAEVRSEEEPPRFRGIGMFVSSAIVGIPGFAFKLVGTANDPSVARELDRDPGANVCIESCYVGTIFNPMSAPFWVSSIGLLGGGMNMRARWLAYWDREDGIDRSHAARIATGTGFGLIGGGVLVFVVAQAMTRSTSMSEYSGVAFREAGWWTSLALGYAGAGLAGWGTGYTTGRAQLSVAPLAAPRFAGLSLSGRF